MESTQKREVTSLTCENFRIVEKPNGFQLNILNGKSWETVPTKRGDVVNIYGDGCLVFSSESQVNKNAETPSIVMR